jgi:UDP-GlcNAc:undecaprenyl-phosphate/decaprenyl-phosphate GlcNAc-1-phosphate transferase
MNIVEIISQYWGSAVFSFGLAFLLIVLALFVFPKIGLMDRPAKYGLFRKPIPYYGGVMIFLAFFVSVLIFVPLDRELIGFLIGAFLVAGVGFLDDYFDLSPLIRLVLQFVAALILVICGVGILSINLPFLGVLDFSQLVFGGIMVLSALFTIVWVMVTINVMNFLDGVSGLNSSVTFVAALTLFFLSIHPNLHADPASQVPVATIALIVAMIALAFLIFDFPKPKILMGDTGSTFFGFVLATLAIFSGGKVATAFLVLGIPILDMIWVVLRRLFSGQKIWKGDLKHLHHRLLDLKMSAKGVVLVYLLISAALGGGAILLVSSQQKLFMIIALILLMVVMGTAIVLSARKRV